MEDGALAEDCVADWFAARGWRVLARRWRGGGGELDLVVGRGGSLRFVEVKLRAAEAPEGWEIFTPAKMDRVRRAADAWLAGWRGPLTDCALCAALVSRDPGGWRVDILDDAA